MRLLHKTGPMESLRKWFYKPKRDDRSLLAQFFFADDALNMVAAELDSFDGRKDPERCSTLVNQLRHAQDRVLNITSQIMDQVLGDERVARGFRVKFPEDVLQDNLAGQLWFGAECLAAGSSIMNREEESAAMRPLAKALTRSLETVRSLLREQCLRPRALALAAHDDMLRESLRIFDRLFAEFELCYVSAMVNVKSEREFEAQQLICVLFSESLRQALRQGLLTQEQVDSYDPALMFAVPRLGIVAGLLDYCRGPLSIDRPTEEMSDMFRPFRTLLHKIRALLCSLERRELRALRRLLCSSEQLAGRACPAESTEELDDQYPDIGEFVSRFYADHAPCRDLYSDLTSLSEQTITEADDLADGSDVRPPAPPAPAPAAPPAPPAPAAPAAPPAPEDDQRGSSDTASTDTFQDTNYMDPRRISREEKENLQALRNLSTNGLNMFDPLVINAVSETENRQLPDNDLVTSLNEQVTEITDRLSSIASNEERISESNHSFSTNNVPTLLATESEEFFTARTEQLNCMPSTSHGYLIPNAISQEPVVLAALSHNNSAVFNAEETESVVAPESNDIASNISIANANLSSLLLTNEEYRNNFHEGEGYRKADATERDEDRVTFSLGYESEHESPADSGVSTENTSLDRSPDADTNKEHFMKQNRLLKTPETIEDKSESVLENSFSENNGDVTLNLNYEEDEQFKNEASSSCVVDDVNESSERDTESEEERKRVLQEWGANASEEEYRTIGEVITELRRHREADKVILEEQEARREASSSRQKKSRKAKAKKKTKMWSPGKVILENRSQPQSPLRLDLERFVESSSSPECADDEQIALALQAQELAARRRARGNFKSSADLLQRLFVCVAGVADQLQTNFAADLRNILKSVFQMNQSPEPPEPPEPPRERVASELRVMQNGSSFDSVYSAEEVYADSNSTSSSHSDQHSDQEPSRTDQNLSRTDQNLAHTDQNLAHTDQNLAHTDQHSPGLDQNSSRLNDDPAQNETARLVRRNTVNSTTMEATTSERRKSIDGRRKSVDGNASADTGRGSESPPAWVPDVAAPACMRCAAHFTAFRRRHHCRNCGEVFCAACSARSRPLPRFGQLRPVRVCERCCGALAARDARDAQRTLNGNR